MTLTLSVLPIPLNTAQALILWVLTLGEDPRYLKTEKTACICPTEKGLLLKSGREGHPFQTDLHV